jgi:hypothetical protein
MFISYANLTRLFITRFDARRRGMDPRTRRSGLWALRVGEAIAVGSAALCICARAHLH